MLWVVECESCSASSLGFNIHLMQAVVVSLVSWGSLYDLDYSTISRYRHGSMPCHECYLGRLVVLLVELFCEHHELIIAEVGYEEYFFNVGAFFLHKGAPLKDWVKEMYIII